MAARRGAQGRAFPCGRRDKRIRLRAENFAGRRGGRIEPVGSIPIGLRFLASPFCNQRFQALAIEPKDPFPRGALDIGRQPGKPRRLRDQDVPTAARLRPLMSQLVGGHPQRELSNRTRTHEISGAATTASRSTSRLRSVVAACGRKSLEMLGMAIYMGGRTRRDVPQPCVWRLYPVRGCKS